MKSAAAPRFLLCALLVGAVLLLPWGNLAAAGAPAMSCHPGQGFSPGPVLTKCCCLPGATGHSGTCGHHGLVSCQCSFSDLASLAPLATGIPAWQAASIEPASITFLPQGFPPNIFHPPEHLQPVLHI